MTEWIYDPQAGRCRKTVGGQAVSDKIAEIQERNLLKRISQKEPEIAIRELYYDLVTLAHLAERQFDKIQQLRAENERLCNEDTKTRHALGGWVWVCPDGGDEPTHERVAAVVAEVERLTGKLKLVADALNETISKYHEVGDQNDRLDAENERLCAALKGIDALNPDALDALVASDLRVIVAQMGDLAVKALEGKP